MTISLWVSTLAVFLVAFTSNAEVRADSEWQAISLVEEHGFSIRLKAKKVASPADDSWLLLELENQSSPQTFVENLHYRIEYKAKPAGQTSGWSSSLCQGSEIEVFPRAWDTTPVSRRFLEKGHTAVVMEPLSYSAAATLQDRPSFFHGPRGTALDVSATAHFTLTVSFGYGTEKSRIATPKQGIPFEFRWEPPLESAIPTMQQRWRTLCKDKDNITDVRALPSSRLACALMEVPEVAAGLSDAELQDASLLTGAFNRDVSLAAQRCLFERDPADRRYLDAVLKMIRDNPEALNLVANSDFWHPELVEGIVAATRNRRSRHFALRLLEAHRDDWQTNPKLIQQLGEIDNELARLGEIDKELARQSWWNKVGLPAIVLGVTAMIASSLSVRLWKRWKSKRAKPQKPN